jgi:hypothetical protein
VAPLLVARSSSAIREERSSTRPVVGRWEQLVQGYHVLGVKFPVNMASYTPLDADDTGAAGGAIPILYMRSTPPRLEVGMCANGCAAIRLLLTGRGLLVAVS